MSKQTDDTLFDVRVLEHRLRRGEISREEYAKHLSSIDDDAAEAADTETRFKTPYWDRHYDPNGIQAAPDGDDDES